MLRSFQGAVPRIEPTAFIAETAVVCGDVVIGPESSVWYHCVVRGDVNFIRIGARTNIQDLSTLHVTSGKGADDPGAPLIIGDGVTVGHGVILHGCTIGDGAFIGMQAVVMDRVVVGAGALVGARSLVTEGTVIPPHTLWLGTPARYKRDLDGEEIDRLLRSAENYACYGQRYLAEVEVPAQ